MSIFHEIAETGDECGHCKGCRWWQAEHEELTADAAVIGLCMQPELTHFSIFAEIGAIVRFRGLEGAENVAAIPGHEF